MWKCEHLPDSQQELEVRGAEAALDRVEIVQQAGEEPEERLLLEGGALLFMHVRKDEHEDGQDLRQVVDLRLVVVDPRRVAVVLDDVHDQARHGVEGLEGEAKLSCVDVLDVAVDARLCTDTEEERRGVLGLQDALPSELRDVRHERLLWRVRPLVDADPLLEPNEQLLAQALRLRLDGGLPDWLGLGSCLSWPANTAQFVEEP